MSEKEKLPRPRQVTLASVMAVVGSVVLVITLVDSLGRLTSVDTRREIDEFLAEPPGSGLGVDAEQVIDLMRVMTYVSGVLAAITLVLGVFVAQRHHGARIGLTVAAAFLLLTVPVAGMMPFFVAVAVVLLWSRPARDWFAGRPAAEPERRPAFTASQSEPERADAGPGGQGGQGGRGSQGDQGGQGGQEWPAATGQGGQSGQEWPAPAAAPTAPGSQGHPTDPWVGPPTWQSQPPPPAYPGVPQPPGGAHSPAERSRRPMTVTVAAVLTWIGAGVTAALALLVALAVGIAPDEVVAEFDRVSEQSGTDLTLSRQEVLATAWATVAVLLVWSLVAILLAVLAFRRSNVGRVLLAVSAAMTALISLVSILSLVPVVTLLMGVATVVLLFTGGANAWYRGDTQHQRAQPPGDQRGPW